MADNPPAKRAEWRHYMTSEEMLDTIYEKSLFGEKAAEVMRVPLLKNGTPDINAIAEIFGITQKNTIRPRGDYLIEDKTMYINPLKTPQDARLAAALAVVHQIKHSGKKILTEEESDQEYALAIYLLTPEPVFLPKLKAVVQELNLISHIDDEDLFYIFDRKNQQYITRLANELDVTEDVIFTRLVSLGFVIRDEEE